MKSKLSTASKQTHPLISVNKRMSAWRAVKGLWKKRKPDPIQELKRSRKQWQRKLPQL